jgi:hypothetical protein
MDLVPFNSSVVAITGGTIVGVTLSGVTILGSTLSGNTLVNSTISGGTYVGGTFSGNTIIGPTLSGGTSVGMTLSGVAIVGSSTFSGSTITCSGFTADANAAVTATKTGALSLITTNNASSTGDFARIGVKADSAASANFDAFSSGYTGAVWGITLANYQVFSASNSASNGLIFGHTANKPVIFGINTSEVARFSSGTLASGVLSVSYTTASSSTTTGALTVAGGVGAVGAVNAASVAATGAMTCENFALTAVGTGTATFSILDNSATPFLVQQGSNAYITVTSTNSGEQVQIGNATTKPSVICGGSAPATNATRGFLYVPACTGTPTGAPTAVTGYAPIIVDATNNKLYFYSNAAWRDAGP